MKLIEESDFSTSIPKKGEYFISRLKKLQKKYPQIGDVDGIGLAIRVEMCQKDGYTPNKELTDAIVELGLSGKLSAGGFFLIFVGGVIFRIAYLYYLVNHTFQDRP